MSRAFAALTALGRRSRVVLNNRVLRRPARWLSSGVLSWLTQSDSDSRSRYNPKEHTLTAATDTARDGHYAGVQQAAGALIFISLGIFPAIHYPGPNSPLLAALGGVAVVWAVVAFAAAFDVLNADVTAEGA